MAIVWPCIVSVDYLSGLTEDTSMITVSSCGVKLQEVLSGLEKKNIGHTLALLWRFSTYIFSFHLGCNFFLST